MIGMNRMSLRTKLNGLTAVVVVALLVLVAVVLQGERRQLMADRQEKVRNLVETAQSVVALYEKEARDGKKSLAEAKRLAGEAIRAMRYEKTEYFWVNDFKAVVVMHPIKPELDGQDLSAFKDKNGKAIFAEFARIAREQGGGYVDYVWPKPGSDAAVPKISYVKASGDWGWVVGSGIYIDDLNDLFLKNALSMLVWVGLIGGFIACSLAMVSQQLIRTLGGDPQYASEITKRIASGDLTAEVVCRPGDDSSLLAGMKAMQQTLYGMIGEILHGAEELASASSKMLDAFSVVSERTEQQGEAASSMAAAVEEMTVSIANVAENAGEAHHISQQASELATSGTQIISDASNEMQQISAAVQSSSVIIEELGRQSEQISSIVNTIREIADQTNLLALNAAIEAARAGEQGRGFAVVADEVRKLAERTSQSTSEIGSMVGRIQEGTRKAVDSMQVGVVQAGKGVELATQAGGSINEIQSGSVRVTEVVNNISTSIREQGSVSAEIAKNIESVARMSEESALAVKNTSEAARHLKALSVSLHQSVSRFKLR